MKLRAYQMELVKLSNGRDNVLLQADTGAGKTHVLAQITKNNRYVLCIAHRNILIKQLSRTLAQFKISHDVLATKSTKRQCATEHRRLGLGDDFLKKSTKYVCSIDSLLSCFRRGKLQLCREKQWTIIVDEAHHMIDKNKWGELTRIFPNSRIIGATATPCRLDQVSLAYDQGGVFHRLAQAEKLKKDSVTTLIEKGFLSEFKCYSLPERLDYSKLKLGTHDYTYKSLESETGRRVFEMAGDAVEHYRRLASGKQALVFCVSIKIAQKTAEMFKDAGIPSAAIHSKLSGTEVIRIFKFFEQRYIKVLMNVDMIGEGVDIPAIEALIMMRKTASFGLFRQWCGRALRPELNKTHAILIDHVGNLRTHGMPDKHIEWNLENPPQASKSNLFPCPQCFFLVMAWQDECPECGYLLTRAVDAKTETDIRYINYTLVEMQRREIDKKIKAEALAAELRTNLQILYENTGEMGALKSSIHQVKLWAASVLQKQNIPIFDLNRFFNIECEQDFWLENFVLSDIGKNNQKCNAVYQKWLKSQ